MADFWIDGEVRTTAIANLIRDGKTYQISSMMQMAKADGMQLLDQAIMELLSQKILSPEAALQKRTTRRPSKNI